MIIRAVDHNISFGRKKENVVEKVKEEYKKTEVGADAAIAGALGTGTAVTVSNITKGGKAITLAKKVLPSDGKSVFNVFRNTKTSCIKWFEDIKPLAKFIKWGPVKGIVGLVGTLAGITAFITNGINIVGTTAKVVEKDGVLA